MFSFGDAQEEPPSHIPRFLPALPDQHTYRQTPTYEGRELDIKGATQTMYKNNRQADKALLGLLVRSLATSLSVAKGEVLSREPVGSDCDDLERALWIHPPRRSRRACLFFLETTFVAADSHACFSRQIVGFPQSPQTSRFVCVLDLP